MILAYSQSSRARITEIFAAIAMLMAAMIGSPAQASIEHQRQLFHDASHALERNQISKFNRLLKQLDDYPAQAYLEYDAFRRNVSRLKPQQVDLFLQRYADYPFRSPCSWTLARYPGTTRRLGRISAVF